MPVISITLDRKRQFEEEAVPHRYTIYRAALRLVGCAARAEDVTQEVYLVAWRCFDRYTPGTNCRAWLFRILFHTLGRYWRKEPRGIAGPAEAKIALARIPAPTPVSDRLTDQDLIAQLHQLPSQFEEVLTLVDIDELSYRDAADRLGIPMGTVMSRLSRARQRMRDMILETRGAA